MKKGINLWCFPNDWSLEKKLSLASEAGFDGIEINLDESGDFHLESTKKEIEEISTLIKLYNLEIVGISTALLWNYPLTSNDETIRQKGISIIQKMITFAELFKVDTVLVVPGLVSEEVSYDIAYERSKKALIQLSGYAEEKGVTIAIENVWNKFLLSPLEMKKFIEEIGSPFVKAYFDVGNISAIGFPEQWISILGTYIQRIHVKDYKKDVGTIHGFTSLFQGDVNWLNVHNSLEKIHYQSYITAEVMPTNYFPEKHIYDLSASIEAIIRGGIR
jgi:L-ribulose-5-phosphate 3-epimerase